VYLFCPVRASSKIFTTDIILREHSGINIKLLLFLRTLAFICGKNAFAFKKYS